MRLVELPKMKTVVLRYRYISFVSYLLIGNFYCQMMKYFKSKEYSLKDMMFSMEQYAGPATEGEKYNMIMIPVSKVGLRMDQLTSYPEPEMR